jgi:endonuclease G
MKYLIKLSFVALISINILSCAKDNTSVDTTKSVGSPIVAPAVAPPTASTDSTLIMGNPSNASTNILDFGNYLLKEIYYSVSYNRDRGIPNWVSWHVSPLDFGAATRQDDFRGNPNLPLGWYKVENTSYSSSGFDRGHMCPSADRTSSVIANSATFLMTNIIPQAPRNNQITWAGLEDYCRALVIAGNELYVISGSYGEGGSTSTGGLTTSIDNGRVVVPATLWKVIVVLPNGANDLSRVNNATRVISVVIPNNDNVSSDWKIYRNSVDFIEQETGYNLLSNVSTNIQGNIESIIDNQ